MNGLLYGFLLGFSLIFAIGPQNIFVLKQGLKVEHIFWVCLICSLSDALLIAIGVSGFYVFIEKFPWISIIARYGGAAFLFFYGFTNLQSSLKTNHRVEFDDVKSKSFKKVMLTCLGFTWLNPHVYLDTIFLIGSVSSKYRNEALYFWFGTSIASFVFFYSLGYGAQLLKPLFSNPLTWKITEFVIGIIMLIIGFSLLKSYEI